MNYREATILASEDASAAATKTIDINMDDVISRIQVKFNATNSTHDATAHPAKIISKVEMVDGSDVLLSLNGMELEALAFYDQGTVRPIEMEYRNGCEMMCVYDLNFGRYLYDEALALDPTKFSNLQLKITHDDALGAGAPSASTMEVVADIFDEKKPSPGAFLTSKEFYTYTLTDGTYEYIDLPTDLPMRKLLIGSLGAGKFTDNQLDSLKLSENNDKKIPLDIDVIDYMRYVLAKYGPYTEAMAGCHSSVATHDWYCTCAEPPVCAISPIGNADIYTTDERAGGYVSLACSAINVFRANLSGYVPHGYLPVEFGKQDMIEDWYDVTKLGSLRLRIKSGSSVLASSTAQIITEQIRRY